MEHHNIPWIQIPVYDLKRAASFYENVLDASFFFEDLNNMPHAIFKENENGIKLLNGALVKIKKNDALSSGPILFFDATGIFDVILKLIKENGGEIIKDKKLITKKESTTS